MAWRLLFVTSRDTTAASKAFQLRERLPDLERYVVEGLYYSAIAGDRTRSAAAYERALDIDPSELRALNNLAGYHGRRDEFEESERLFRRAASIRRSSSSRRIARARPGSPKSAWRRRMSA